MLLYIVDDNTCISKNITHIKVKLQDQQKLLLFNVATSNIVNSEETHQLNFAPHLCRPVAACAPSNMWSHGKPHPPCLNLKEMGENVLLNIPI
jgi:hypothetical protein